MPAEAFFDTNILIHAFAAGPKGDKAEALLSAGGGASVQAHNEFVNVCLRKLGLGWDEIEERLSVLNVLLEEPVAVTHATHERARAIAKKHKLSFYDALMLAAAIEAGAKTLYSEDMQSGFRLDGLTIVNPFA